MATTLCAWLFDSATRATVYCEPPIGWNDAGGVFPVQHRLTLRSSVYR